MSLSKEQIRYYARRYVNDDEMVRFPKPGDLFSLLKREIPNDRVLGDRDGWEFECYGILLEYELDTEAKPLGKWIFMNYATLGRYPPWPLTFRLQPPHIVRGRFPDDSRTEEYKIETFGDLSKIPPPDGLDEDGEIVDPDNLKPGQRSPSRFTAGKLLKFRVRDEK